MNKYRIELAARREGVPTRDELSMLMHNLNGSVSYGESQIWLVWFVESESFWKVPETAIQTGVDLLARAFGRPAEVTRFGVEEM